MLLPAALLGCPSIWAGDLPEGAAEMGNGLKSGKPIWDDPSRRLRVEPAGHNNTKPNPVFRGMVRPIGGL